jgi:hypothetical protein
MKKFDITSFFQLDATGIVTARDTSILVHRSGDIKAAGNIVEEAVRNMLHRRLPKAYHVGHGHLVDIRLKTSPQIDLIIADAVHVPILFRAEDGTEYFPYESVYAIGEVKSSYSRSSTRGQIETFSRTIATIKSGLSREDNSTNPLFSFMVFVTAGDFSGKDIAEFYDSRSTDDLPHVLCFLDWGVVTYAIVTPSRTDPQAVPNLDLIHPYFDRDKEGRAGSYKSYIFLKYGMEDRQRLAASFSMLYFSLLRHLTRSTLTRPDIPSYFSHAFSYDLGGPIGKERS